MSAKLIIWIPGQFLITGYKRGDFLWDNTYKKYVYKSRLFTEREFNAEAEKIFKQHHRIFPQVHVVEYSDEAKADLGPDLAPVATISPAHEITAEEAEAVMERLAPWRLKPQPGKVAGKPAMRTG